MTRSLSRLTLAAAVTASLAVFAGHPAAKPKGGDKGAEKAPPANVEGETLEALKLKGDARRGQEAYDVCAACHSGQGKGRSDGAFPQLAGQHPSVIIKQVADIRSGKRDNPVMHPFSKTLTSAQELADVAAYIATLPIARDNQKGSGTDLAGGKMLYERDCQMCHGANGEGNAEKVYPVLAGQHYAYLLRQAKEIRDGKRHNANPEMVKTVKSYSDKELEAIVDYMSRLQTPAPK